MIKGEVLRHGKTLVLGAVALVLLTGCVGKESIPNPDRDLEEKINENKFGQAEVHKEVVAPYQLKITPIVGSRANDAKVVVDTGKVLKIWVAPYKQGLTLNASHDVYTFVKAPEFVLGEVVPRRKKSPSLLTPSSRLPFMISDDQLNIDTTEKELTDGEVKEYVNNLYEARSKAPDADLKRVDEQRKQREEILKFLNERRNEK